MRDTDNKISKTEEKEFLEKTKIKFEEIHRKYIDEIERYLLLVNTGGTVAVLAFMGAAIKAKPDEKLAINIKLAFLSLTFFVMGVLACGVLRLLLIHEWDFYVSKFKRDVKKYENDWICFDEVLENINDRKITPIIDYIIGYTSGLTALAGTIVGLISLFIACKDLNV